LDARASSTRCGYARTRTRTGADNGVVNSFGQTHEIPNLYVAGPGIFATSGASNPTYITLTKDGWRQARGRAAELERAARVADEAEVSVTPKWPTKKGPPFPTNPGRVQYQQGNE
jgi:hypothetical protein